MSSGVLLGFNLSMCAKSQASLIAPTLSSLSKSSLTKFSDSTSFILICDIGYSSVLLVKVPNQSLSGNGETTTPAG